MKKRSKKRVIKALITRRWSYMSARFIASMLRVEKPHNNYKRPNPSVMEIASFLRLLKNEGIVQTRVAEKGYPILYQLKDGFHKVEDVEREIGL